MRLWRCTVCDYVHRGETPPAECPVCGVGPEMFEEVEGETAEEPITAEERAKVKAAIHKFSYGLFVIGSRKGDSINAQTANTAFQITSDPDRVAIGINKANLTWEYISQSRVFSISILGRGQIDTVKHFGFQSGRKVDKFSDVSYFTAKTGAPILEDCLAWLDCQVQQEVDVGTHTIFVGLVVGGDRLKDEDPLTYAYYRQNR